MLDKVTEASLLFDFYGNLLTENQRKVMELYHEENLSLGEIATENNISRQAVHISLKKAEGTLKLYEDKLGLLHRWIERTQLLEKLERIIKSININNLSDEDKIKLDQILGELEGID
ncbi:YlxM family DNA-binding protein [Eubacteriales bacterium KG127]